MKKKNSIIAIGIVVSIGLIVFLASFTSAVNLIISANINY